MVMMIAAGGLAGCGTDSDQAPDAAMPPATTVAPVPEPADPDDDEEATPTGQAIAMGLHFQALVNAYAPITARIDFLVAAETLRADAVDAGAGADVERERSGSVKIELDRLRRVLRAARPEVESVDVADENQRRVQQLMLLAIDSRTRALDELRAHLVAIPDETVGDREVERLEQRWRASWDASLRSARDATTRMQDSRQQLGLEPALEEAIR